MECCCVQSNKLNLSRARTIFISIPIINTLTSKKRQTIVRISNLSVKNINDKFRLFPHTWLELAHCTNDYFPSERCSLLSIIAVEGTACDGKLNNEVE